MPWDESLLEEEISGFDPSLLEEETTPSTVPALPVKSTAPRFVSDVPLELPGGLMAASRRWEEQAFAPVQETEAQKEARQTARAGVLAAAGPLATPEELRRKEGPESVFASQLSKDSQPAKELITQSVLGKWPSADAADPRFRSFIAGTGLFGKAPTEEDFGFAAGLVNTAKGFGEFTTSPLGISTMGLGAAGGPIAHRAIGLGFLLDIFKNAPEQAKQWGETEVTGTPQQKWESRLGALASGAFAAGLGKAQVSGGIPKFRKEIAEVRGRPEAIRREAIPTPEQLRAPAAPEAPAPEPTLEQVNARINELQADPEVTGQRVVGFNPDGSPKFDLAKKNQIKILELDKLQKLQVKLQAEPKPSEPVTVTESKTGLTPSEAAELNDFRILVKGGARLNENNAKRFQELESKEAKVSVNPAESAPAAAPEVKPISEALKDLPAVPEGKVRLYRGEGGAMPESSELGGDWYTTNPEKAAQFGPKLQYVDVSPEEAAAARQRAKDKGRGGDTVILTKESLAKTKPVPGEVAPKVHDLEAPVEAAKPTVRERLEQAGEKGIKPESLKLVEEYEGRALELEKQAADALEVSKKEKAAGMRKAKIAQAAGDPDAGRFINSPEAQAASNRHDVLKEAARLARVLEKKPTKLAEAVPAPMAPAEQAKPVAKFGGYQYGKPVWEVPGARPGWVSHVSEETARARGFEPEPAAPEPKPAAAAEPAPALAAREVAAPEAPKWTSATSEDAGLGAQLGAGIPNPVATFKSAVSLAKHSAKVLGPKIKNVIEAVKELGQQEANAPRMTDYRRAVLGWSAKLQQSFGEAASAQRDIQKAVPDPVRREGITNWIEADGDANVLQQRAAQTKDERTRKGYEAALNLTPDEIAVARDVKAAFDALGQRGQTHDVVSNFRDNYVTHIWDTGKGPAMGSSRTLKDRFRYNKARTFATFFEGEQAGYTAKTKDISKILPVYLHEMNSVIAARQLVAQMSKGTASDGRPLVVPRGIGVPVESKKFAVVNTPGGRAVRVYDTQAQAQAALKSGQSIEPRTDQATLVFPDVSKVETGDYKTMTGQPALTDWKYLSRDTAGNPVMLKSDLAIHPEAFARIKAVLGKSAIREWYQSKTSAAAEIPKLIAKGLDRVNSETKRTMLGLLAPFHQVQEATHAVGHRVNPLFSIPKVDLVNDTAQMDAARHGLMLLPDRVSEGQFMEGFRTSGLVSKLPGIGKVADWYSNYLFHEYIPGLKFKTYSAILDRNLKVYSKELASGSIKPEDVKALSGEQTNAAFGHLNYADLGRNPTIQHIMQLGLLAPDFLEARARFTGQGLKGATGTKVGREQILALATLAVAQAGLAYTSAKLTGGEWDKKRPFEFVKDNRRYTLRSVPEDISSLIRDTRVFTHSRLSPIVGKGALQYASGVDWRGRKVGALETTKELVKQPIPLTVKGFFGIGNSPLSSWEQLAGAVGLRISRYSAANDIFQMVNEWAKNNPDARIQAQAEQRERETFASKYEGLHQAISANDKGGVAAELEKLRKSMPLNAIIDYMRTYSERPFTGSATNEKQFLRSLSESDRALYWQAREQRKEELKKFYQMLP